MSGSRAPTPKHGRNGRSSFYSYYAGFSAPFARFMLANLSERSDGIVLDPWNGAGTTTAAAAALGLDAVGRDLNPAMVVVAKGRMLSPLSAPSIAPLTHKIIAGADLCDYDPEVDPLDPWFVRSARNALRRIERSTFECLVSATDVADRVRRIADSSDVACFFYTGLFNIVRSLLRPLRATNPTWTKRPRSPAGKLRPDRDDVVLAFEMEMQSLAESLAANPLSSSADSHSIDIQVGDSTAINLSNASVATILTSPPYCTRIDYAVSTSGELALLGVTSGAEFDALRSKLMGTATVKVAAEQELIWGPTCLRFLDRVYTHPSVASSGYYYKSHCQYFADLYRSIGELSRVLKKGGRAALVLQNSYYKEVLNDLPQICIEMAESHQLTLDSAQSFPVPNSFAQLNPRAQKYKSRSRAEWEEVVVLERH